jgi:hypothetical protein
MAPIPGRAFLNRVIERVHVSVQEAPSQEDYDLGTITLQLLSLLSHHEPATLDLATIPAFGMRFEEWRHRNELRKSHMAWKLSKCGHALASDTLRPERLSGNVYAMPRQESQPSTEADYA